MNPAFPNQTEWLRWTLQNGLPAIFAGLMFIFVARFDKFGWDVAPRGMGQLFGAGFLFRAAMYVQIFTATSYSQIRWLHAGNVVFAAVLLGTTLVWGDRFHWKRLIAIAWTYLYIEEPVWMLTLWPRSEAAMTLTAGPGPGPLLQAGLFIEAAAMLAFGLYLFRINRSDSPRFFPFKPDFMSGRIWSGFPLAWAVWAPALALSTWDDARGGVLVNLVFLAGVPLVMLLWRGNFDLSRRPAQLMLGLFAGLAALIGAGVLLQGG